MIVIYVYTFRAKRKLINELSGYSLPTKLMNKENSLKTINLCLLLIENFNDGNDWRDKVIH